MEALSSSGKDVQPDFCYLCFAVEYLHLLEHVNQRVLWI